MRTPPRCRAAGAGSSRDGRDHLRRVLRPHRLGAELAGGSAQVLIPNRAHSIDSVRIMFSTAARAAPEWTIPGIPLWGESVTLSTLPALCGMNAFVAAAWVISQVPITLSSITVRKPFGEIASAGLRNCPPALLTSTSSLPWRSSTPSNSRRPPPRRGCPSLRHRPCRPGLRFGHRLRQRFGPAARIRRPSHPAERAPAPPPAEARARAGDHADLPVEQARAQRFASSQRPWRATLYGYAPGDEGPRGNESAHRAASGGSRRRHGLGRADPRPAPWRAREPGWKGASADRRCGCSDSAPRDRNF